MEAKKEHRQQIWRGHGEGNFREKSKLVLLPGGCIRWVKPMKGSH